MQQTNEQQSPRPQQWPPWKYDVQSDAVIMKLPQREQILLRPIPYMGNPRRTSYWTHVYDHVPAANKHVWTIDHAMWRNVTVSPALLTCLSEMLVNALDHSQRDRAMSYIKVWMDNGGAGGRARFAVENDMVTAEEDPGILSGGTRKPIRLPLDNHPTEGVALIELAFGHLNTSTNYGAQQRTWGGQNGLGAKVANLTAHECWIRVCAGDQAYEQRFRDHMRIIDPPKRGLKADSKMLCSRTSDVVYMSCAPDLVFFDEDDPAHSRRWRDDDDHIAVMRSRVVEAVVIAQLNRVTLFGSDVTPLTVEFNDQRIQLPSFKHWAAILGTLSETCRPTKAQTAATAAATAAAAAAAAASCAAASAAPTMDATAEEKDNDSDKDEVDSAGATESTTSDMRKPLRPIYSTIDRKTCMSSVTVLSLHPRWTVAIAPSPWLERTARNTQNSKCCIVSYVNGVYTPKDGTHVNLVTQPIVKALVDKLQRKFKDAHALITTQRVRSHMLFVINCTVSRAEFTNQAKHELNMKPSLISKEDKFEWTEELEKQLLKSPVYTYLEQCTLRWIDNEQRKPTSATAAGGVGASGHSAAAIQARLSKYKKLYDATMAGKHRRRKANEPKRKLILVEGDSAQALAVSGRSQTGPEYIGIYPLRGKVLNALSKSKLKLMKNKEIQAIVDILDLEWGREYDIDDPLRYDEICLMVDRDSDGFGHIAILVITLFFCWPSLLKRHGFLNLFATPINSATHIKDKRRPPLWFYSPQEFHQWLTRMRNEGGTLSDWSIKQHKGLGSSTSRDARYYFAHLDKHTKPIVFDVDFERDRSLLERVMGKKAHLKRAWFMENMATVHEAIDYGRIRFLTFQDYVRVEVFEFFREANARAIGNIVNGLTPVQLKLLSTMMIGKPYPFHGRAEKVVAVAGKMIDKYHYYHGETSAYGSSIGMAQNFVGAWNVPLLVPNGQFGTRLAMGADASQPRYLYTQLQPLARALFPPEDDAVVDRIQEGTTPLEYMVAGVVPSGLLNGSDNVGAGWRTQAPSFHPMETSAAVRARIRFHRQWNEHDAQQRQHAWAAPPRAGCTTTTTTPFTNSACVDIRHSRCNTASDKLATQVLTMGIHRPAYMKDLVRMLQSYHEHRRLEYAMHHSPGVEPPSLTPWYHMFRGTIQPVAPLLPNLDPHVTVPTWLHGAFGLTTESSTSSTSTKRGKRASLARGLRVATKKDVVAHLIKTKAASKAGGKTTGKRKAPSSKRVGASKESTSSNKKQKTDVDDGKETMMDTTATADAKEVDGAVASTRERSNDLTRLLESMENDEDDEHTDAQLSSIIMCRTPPNDTTGSVLPHVPDKHPHWTNRFLCMGHATVKTKDPPQIEIDELPVGMSTLTFKAYLDRLRQLGTRITHYDEGKVTECAIHYTLHLRNDTSAEQAASQAWCQLLETVPYHFYYCWGMVVKLDAHEMVWFNAAGQIETYWSPEQCLDEHYAVRYELYVRRKRHIMQRTEHACRLAYQRLRYACCVVQAQAARHGTTAAASSSSTNTSVISSIPEWIHSSDACLQHIQTVCQNTITSAASTKSTATATANKADHKSAERPSLSPLVWETIKRLVQGMWQPIVSLALWNLSSKQALCAWLERHSFQRDQRDVRIAKLASTSTTTEESESMEDEKQSVATAHTADESNTATMGGYGYLTSMPSYRFVEEEMIRWIRLLDEAVADYVRIQCTSEWDLWERDLTMFEQAWQTYHEQVQQQFDGTDVYDMDMDVDEDHDEDMKGRSKRKQSLRNHVAKRRVKHHDRANPSPRPTTANK